MRNSSEISKNSFYASFFGGFLCDLFSDFDSNDDWIFFFDVFYDFRGDFLFSTISKISGKRFHKGNLSIFYKVAVASFFVWYDGLVSVF